MIAGPDISMVMRRRVIQAFWHRTRRCWVPLTRAELLAKVFAEEVEVMPVLRGLIRDGLVAVGYVSDNRSSLPIFETTVAGRSSLHSDGLQVQA